MIIRSAFFTAVSSVAILLGAGCASNEFSYNATIAGGEKMKFTLVKGQPEWAKADGIKIVEAGLRPDVDKKKVIYGFQFIDSANHNVTNVRIEDVSDETAILLHEDTQPKVTNQHWGVVTPPLESDSPALRWVFYVNSSVRVYRFTITMADGKKVVLHQAAMIPAWMKAAIRGLFGEKY